MKKNLLRKLHKTVAEWAATAQIIAAQIVAATVVASCGSPARPNTAPQEEVAQTAHQIRYTIGHNYRPRPTVPADDIPRTMNNRGVRDCFLTSDTLNDANAQPTYIDFKNETVVNIVLPPTLYPTELSVEQVSVTPDKTLRIEYKAQRGSKSAFEMTPYMMLIVNNKDIEECKEVIICETGAAR